MGLASLSKVSVSGPLQICHFTDLLVLGLGAILPSYNALVDTDSKMALDTHSVLCATWFGDAYEAAQLFILLVIWLVFWLQSSLTRQIMAICPGVTKCDHYWKRN